MPPVAEQDAPAADRVLVSQPDASALFMARRSELKLVKVKVRPIRDAGGDQVDETEGQRIIFRDGVLRVPLTPDAEVKTESDGRVPAEEVLTFLRKHRLNGNLEEGFWEVDPVAPPISPEETEALVDLAINLDADGLHAFIAAEEGGWKRERLVTAAKGTLQRVEAQVAARDQAVADATAAAEAKAQQAIAAARAEGEAAGKKAAKAKPPAAA